MAKQKFVSFANLFSVSNALRDRAKAEAANVQSAYDATPGMATDAETKAAASVVAKRMMVAYNYATGRV